MIKNKLYSAVLAWLLGVTSSALAQSKLVQSSRYLQLRVQNYGYGISQFADEPTAPVSGLYNLGITAGSAAGVLTAAQSTILDDSKASGNVRASGGSSGGGFYDYNGSAASKFLVDYVVERPSKYRLRVQSDFVASALAINLIVLGKPNHSLALAAWRASISAVHLAVQDDKLAGAGYGSQEFSGVLEPGTWRLATIMISNSEAERSLSFEFEITSLVQIAIKRQPTSVSVPLGGEAVLSVAATGDFPKYQWSKDGVAIPGATESDLVFNNAQPAQAGRYSVTVTNPLGSVTSTTAELGIATVKAGITAQPSSISRFPGELVTLSVGAVGDGLLYQWKKDGVVIEGATSATLALGAFQPSMVGAYTVTVNNGLGSVTSQAALLSNGSRLLNLSSRVSLETGGGNLLIGGFVLRGSKTRKVLLRAAGPSLSDYGVVNALADPLLTVFDQAGGEIARNDDWSSRGAAETQQLVNAFQATGAFPFSVGSKDSALLMTLVPGSYTVHARGVGDAKGGVLMEIYDTETSSSENTLVNLSTRAFVGTGGSILIQGISVQGASKRLLVRAVGPQLEDYGVQGVLKDPVIRIVNSAGVEVGKNNDWDAASAGSVQAVIDATAATGAFPLKAGSRDSALVVTLPEGGFGVQVSGADGGVGEALVEVYAF